MTNCCELQSMNYFENRVFFSILRISFKKIYLKKWIAADDFCHGRYAHECEKVGQKHWSAGKGRSFFSFSAENSFRQIFFFANTKKFNRVHPADAVAPPPTIVETCSFIHGGPLPSIGDKFLKRASAFCASFECLPNNWIFLSATERANVCLAGKRLKFRTFKSFNILKILGFVQRNIHDWLKF